MATLTKEDIVEAVGSMSLLDVADLVKLFEEKFGVSAMPVASAAAPAAGAAAAPAEEKTSFTVMLTDAGANKLAVIKAVREIMPTLGLMDAKKLVESAPKELLKDAKKADAEEAKKKVETAGGKVELK